MVLEYGEVDLATMLQDKLKERLHGDNLDETWLRFYWRVSKLRNLWSKVGFLEVLVLAVHVHSLIKS